MKRYNSIFIFFFLLLLSSSFSAYSQEVNIVPYLKQIEQGNKSEAVNALQKLKIKYPNDPSVKFLEGILTENGQDALVIYNNIYKKYPHSKYADASLFRIYSYYYSLGLYNAAKDFLDKLKNEYPGSPYLKIANKNIPAKDNLSLTKVPDTAKVPLKNSDTKSIPKETKYKYTIQAGAFSNKANAKLLHKDFIDSGFFSEIKEKNVGGTVFQVVYVGRFVTKEEAKNFLQVVNSEFKLDGRIVFIN